MHVRRSLQSIVFRGTLLALLPATLTLVSLGCLGDSSESSDEGRGEVYRSGAEALTGAGIPGRIEAEDYKAGGEGVGYHDTTKGNAGGAYKTDDVDIEVTSDTSGGYDVGWTAAGEWLAYDVNVVASGSYAISVRMSSNTAAPKSVHFELDGKALAGATATLTGGDGWTSWHDVSAGSVNLTAGAHTLRLVFDTAKVDINYFDVSATRPPLVLGMYDNTAIPPEAEGSTAKNYREVANHYFVGSKLKVDRVFNSSLPSTYAASAGAQDPANGNVSFLSVKPPSNDIAGVAAGKYDAAIKSLAASMPAGSFFTMYHEPEDNMSGAQFVAMFRHFYSVAKAANPNLTIGYIAMAYQWRPGSASTATPDDWWIGSAYTDFLGVDAYMPGWSAKASLDTQADFQRWYGWAKTKGKPLFIPEYGVEAKESGGWDDATRATIIENSLAWVSSQPQIRLLLWWNGKMDNNDWWHLNPTTSEPADNAPLSRAAWNTAVTQYGSEHTSTTTW